METRTFGRTGHASTMAIFGAAAFYECDQATADRAMEQVIAAGINHIDIAPSYGLAEERMGPWIRRERQRFFLGCKTMERTAKGARDEMQRSLERLGTDRFDLYQIHAVTKMEDLDEATRPGGALEAMIRAREEGLTDFIGITGHGPQSPVVFQEALRRFDFDSVLFPVNFVEYHDPEYRREAEALLRACVEKNVGVMAIKSVAREPLGRRPKRYTPWYEPFDQPEMIQQAVNFTLSQDVTGICTVSDTTLLPIQLQAVENFRRLAVDEQEALVRAGGEYQTIFT